MAKVVAAAWGTNSLPVAAVAILHQDNLKKRRNIHNNGYLVNWML